MDSQILKCETDCILRIGVKFEDMDLLPWKYKPIVVVSELFRRISLLFKPLTRLSDSVYVLAKKPLKSYSFQATEAIGRKQLQRESNA